MADSVAPNDIDKFLTNASWAIRSTYHTVLKAFPGAAIFGPDMLFDIPFLADWNKIGDYRQHQTDLNTHRENKLRIDYIIFRPKWIVFSILRNVRINIVDDNTNTFDLDSEMTFIGYIERI